MLRFGVLVSLGVAYAFANGYEVAHWVREQPWGARPTLVAVSSDRNA